MPFASKFYALYCIIRKCKNWPQIVAAKLCLNDDCRTVCLHNGLTIEVQTSIKKNWGQFFESAVVDVYGITHTDADIIVDVGANIGAFTLLAARSQPHAKIFSFEPQREQAGFLLKNVARNNILNVTFTNSPVTADGRNVVMLEQRNDGASNIFNQGEGKSTSRESVTLDQIPINQEESIFFKLDCEGAEGELIRWIISNIDRLPKSIQIACEYHSWSPVPITDSANALTKAGFKISKECHFHEVYLFASR